VWAEQFGLGELGLTPEVFWGLTVREFWLKHAAFARAEDRRRSLVIRTALMTSTYKDEERRKLERQMHALHRYPVKPWLRDR
jgi:hypothetical protein